MVSWCALSNAGLRNAAHASPHGAVIVRERAGFDTCGESLVRLRDPWQTYRGTLCPTFRATRLGREDLSSSRHLAPAFCLELIDRDLVEFDHARAVLQREVPLLEHAAAHV
jgi:hypothetical protein